VGGGRSSLKISVVQGGGFTGLVRTTAADAAELAPADAETLRAKVRDAGLFDLSSATGNPALPDVQSYEITVSDNERSNTVVLGESSLSDEVRALLAWLRTVPGHKDTTG
jgi:hypothetical protein